MVLDMAHEEPPDPRRPQDIFYNEKVVQHVISVWEYVTIKYTGDGLVKAGSVC